MNISKMSVSNTFFKQNYRSEGYSTKPYERNNTTSDVIYTDFVPEEEKVQTPAYSTYYFLRRNIGRVDYNTNTRDCVIMQTKRGLLPIDTRVTFTIPNEDTEIKNSRFQKNYKRVITKPGKKIIQTFDRFSSEIMKREVTPEELRSIVFEAENPTLYIKNGEVDKLITKADGSSYHLRYDEDLKRLIKTSSQNGVQNAAEVIDLTNGTSVTSGDLVLDVEYNQDDDEYITKDIILDSIIERKKYKHRPLTIPPFREEDERKLIYRIVYNKETNAPVYTYNYKNSTGNETRIYANSKGYPFKKQVVNRKNGTEELYVYNNKTENFVLSKEIYYTFFPFKKAYTEIFHDTNLECIDYEVKHKSNYDIVTSYNKTKDKSHNLPVSMKFIQGKHIQKYISLRNDGTTFHEQIEFNPAGEASLTVFDKYGKRKAVEYFDKNDNLKTSVIFASNSKLASVTKYSSKNNGYRQYVYSDSSKYPISVTDVNEEGKSRTTIFNDPNNSKYAIPGLSSSYFRKGGYNSDWLKRKDNSHDFKIENEEEVISKINKLKDIGRDAFNKRKEFIKRNS